MEETLAHMQHVACQQCVGSNPTPSTHAAVQLCTAVQRVHVFDFCFVDMAWSVDGMQYHTFNAMYVQANLHFTALPFTGQK